MSSRSSHLNATSIMRPDASEAPILTAISTSIRQIYQLLKCIAFTNKVHVSISRDEIRFLAEDSRVVQGTVSLDKALFSSYIFRAREDPSPFQISLPALLETLSIFNVSDIRDQGKSSYSGPSAITRSTNSASAFSARALGMTGSCKITYAAVGDPLSVILEETGVTTTCELMTYEPEMSGTTDIPLHQIVAKVIMRASLLFDAVQELSSASPQRLTLTISPSSPHLRLSAAGPHGSASVEFSKSPDLLESFQVAGKISFTYKFASIAGAARAMNLANKASVRVDEIGVLCMQFMVELEGGAGYTIVDLRWVPFVEDEGEEDAVGPEDEDDGELDAGRDRDSGDEDIIAGI